MIRLIQKIIFLWEKKTHLTHVECEMDFMKELYGPFLNSDEQEYREQMAGLKAKRDLKTTDKRMIMELERRISEIVKRKSDIARAEKTIEELHGIIKTTKENLFSWN